jgi:hypothetical protein
MRTVDDLLEEAKRLPLQARRELRDRLAESLEDEEHSAAQETVEGPYAALLKSAGSAHALAPDVARNKNKHLVEIYAPKRTER